VESKRDHRKAKSSAAATATATPQSREIPSLPSSHGDILDNILLSSQWYPVNAGGMVTPASTTNRTSFSPPSLNQESSSIIEEIGMQSSGDEQFELPSWDTSVTDDFWFPVTSTQQPVKPFSELSPKSLENAFDAIPHFEENSLGMNTLDFSVLDIIAPGYRDTTRQFSASKPNRRQKSKFECHFCIASNNTAADYARTTMTQNLIRIYHDSLENALSCWLTEHNCPYSDPLTDMLPYKERNEWSSSWPNRMCIRVCRLDRASSHIRGRSLSADEDKAAARALHLSIIAFASQWTQHAQKGSNLNVPAEIARDERSIRENVWNQARHALEHTTGIPSFRIIFANIIFSLTQCPLDEDEDERLGQLLENDVAPIFLEHANRQLFTFRHKLTRLQREAPSHVRELRRESMGSTLTDMSEVPRFSSTAPADPTLANDEHRTTLSLLFWLGVMFDTLSAAMYQRPLVVSDEDSQITSIIPVSELEDQVDLNGWNLPRNEMQKKKDVWGDFFLHQAEQPRWPCSYEQAASVLSEATPVKVLLYRRVTQLQTLVYRGVGPKRLEEVINETLLVYHHWNNTYQRFMLDCVANHELLPPRIQSWYVILDGHWHLAAMLLADVLETVDRGKLGSDVERESRHSSNLITKLRRENAFAVGALARSSLRGKESIVRVDFHDSLTEVAFLTEPWTVVLIHSFAKAGYISVEGMDMSSEQDSLSECFRQNCEFCISALQYLGRKSDMATLVARDLSRNLNVKLSHRFYVV
jgi:hypothetical protein